MAQENKTLTGRGKTRYAAPTPSAAGIVAGLLVGVAVELVLMAIGKYYTKGTSFGFVHAMVLVLAIVGAAGFVYFTVCAVRAKAAPKDRKLYCSWAVVCLAAAASFLVMRVWWISGVRVLYALWGGVAVLFVLNQIYYREFVCLAGLAGLAAVGAFAGYRSMTYGNVNSTTVTIAVVLVLAAAALAVVTSLAGKKGGSITLFGAPVVVYAMPVSKIVLYVACGVTALCAVAALLLGAAFCYYCFFVALAGLLLSAAFYTIRLM